MNMKKMLSLVLVSAMTLTMAATAFAEEAGGLSGANCDPANTAKTDETLTIGFGSEPSTLVGTATGNTENESMMIFSALTDNLVAYNSLTGEIEPQLATAWEWVDDKHCKFTLRDDVTMSDGTPFVADDVVFSVKMWRDQNATNETGSIFTECADPVADDEHTVTIEFTSNAPDIIRMLTWTNYGIVSEDEVNAAGGFEEVGKNPLVGSGPYKFVSWTNGQNIVIERNEEYWNQDYAGYYKQIVFTFTSDPAARIMAVQSGDADVAYAIPTAQASTFQGNEAVKVVNYTFDQVNHLWFNMGENAGATADQKVREAIDKALDYDAINAVGSAGLTAPSLGYFVEGNPNYNAVYTPEERAVDIEGAKALLEEAGYGDGLTIRALGLSDIEPVYVVMQANLAQAGITLELDIPDTAQFVGQAAGGDYDIIIVGEYAAARFPSIFIFFQNAYTFCIGGPKWTTDEINAKIHDFIFAEDQESATQIGKEFEEMMKESCIQTNLFPGVNSSVINPALKGFNTLERGFMDPTGFYKE